MDRDLRRKPRARKHSGDAQRSIVNGASGRSHPTNPPSGRFFELAFNPTRRALLGPPSAKKVEIGQAKVKNCQLAFGLSLAGCSLRNASSWLDYEPSRASREQEAMQAVRPKSAAARNDTSSQPRGAYGSAPDTVTHSMLEIGGLFEEMASYGISRAALIANTGIELAALDDPAARMTHQQKFCFFAMCNACRLTRSRLTRWSASAPFRFWCVRLCAGIFSHFGRRSRLRR